tara:strand:- start:465 stop:1001 length:537 start_codon:yes stop_codon:yes gene_type:complete
MDSQIKKINVIANYMCAYQKEHNIKGRCLDNVTILYDIIKSSFKSVNPVVKNVIVSYIVNNISYICEGHIVIQLDNGCLIDPSYEITQHEESCYLDNFETFRENVKSNDAVKPLMNRIEKEFNRFKIYATLMNEGKSGISNEKYYNMFHNHLINIGIIRMPKNDLEHLNYVTNIETTS